MTVFAGQPGKSGFVDGKAFDAGFFERNALFYDIRGLAVEANGDVLVSDMGNHCIRRISKGALCSK